LIGYTPQELYADPMALLSLIHADDAALLEAALSQPEQFQEPVILRWRRKDGSVIWAEHRSVVVRGDNGQRIAIEGIARDITRSKQAEEELRRALEKEKEVNELKSRFVSMVPHEFRTPLAVIQSSSDLLMHYANRLTEERRREQLSEIHVQVRRLTSMLDDILTLGRLQAMGANALTKPVDLAKLAQDVVRDIQRTAETHRIELTIYGDFSGVLLDAKLIRQTLNNLLSNAVKYSPQGSTVSFDLLHENQNVVLKIRDRGIGIPEEDQEHLFEVFQRGQNVGTVAGTGLGLAIVKQAVDAHQGTITFESAPNQGTTFTIRLPHKRADANGR
jgi:PAS domain S-box-containing protein